MQDFKQMAFLFHECVGASHHRRTDRTEGDRACVFAVSAYQPVAATIGAISAV